MSRLRMGDRVWSILEQQEYEVVNNDLTGVGSVKIKNKEHLSRWIIDSGLGRTDHKVKSYFKMTDKIQIAEVGVIPAIGKYSKAKS